MEPLTVALSHVTAAGSGLMAGVFFAFSTAVMPALRERPASEGMATMQGINARILNPVFLLSFFGTAMGAAALIVLAILVGGPDRWMRIVGALLSLLGSLVLTSAVNVPLNNRLATMTAGTDEGARFWSHYLRRWTAWNHLRAVLCLAATVVLGASW